jgi:hypothetical protein
MRVARVISYFYNVWKYEKLIPWFNRNKNRRVFKFFENASWFRWYGRRVIKVKPKDSSQLTTPQKAVKEAIKENDYELAYDIVCNLPETKQTITLKQFIESKLK